MGSGGCTVDTTDSGDCRFAGGDLSWVPPHRSVAIISRRVLCDEQHRAGLAHGTLSSWREQALPGWDTRSWNLLKQFHNFLFCCTTMFSSRFIPSLHSDHHVSTGSGLLITQTLHHDTVKGPEFGAARLAGHKPVEEALSGE